MLQRKTPIKRKTPLKRNSKPINRMGRKGKERKDWRMKVRAEYVSEHGWTCQWCGYQDVWGYDPLEIHHKVKRSLGGKDTLENCIALCHFCHTQAHTYIEKLIEIRDSNISLAEANSENMDNQGGTGQQGKQSPIYPARPDNQKRKSPEL